MTNELIAEATGRKGRSDPVLGKTGGPAGNARLTAWTGWLLLILIAVELVTLIDVGGLISWHFAIGALLAPLALLKTATTTWRIARYYAANHPYRQAGPPPTVLRVLGPLVVLTTLAVLGSGYALIIIGPERGRQSLITVLGQRVDALTIHQAAFIGWGVVTGVHVLARLVPAFRLTRTRPPESAPVPGRWRRGSVLVATLVACALAAVLTLPAAAGWQDDGGRRDSAPASQQELDPHTDLLLAGTASGPPRVAGTPRPVRPGGRAR